MFFYKFVEVKEEFVRKRTRNRKPGSHCAGDTRFGLAAMNAWPGIVESGGWM
jgi:hypothetical protein